MTESLTNPQKRKLKAMAQRLDPMVRLGKQGLSDAFVRSVDEALAIHELVKVRFDDFKEQKHELMPELARRTASALIMQVGHVVVLYRQQADPARRRIEL
jgi:RNA-binding protein